MKPIEIGSLATEKAGKKDAIHVPVVAVVARELLAPGEAVVIQDNYANKAVVGESTGIVDPFLKEDVQTGGRFWLFLQPGSVEDLRHEWSTPTFPDNKKELTQDDVDWLEDSCRGCY